MKMFLFVWCALSAFCLAEAPHPRLLFDQEGLTALRARLRQSPFDAMAAALLQRASQGVDTREGNAPMHYDMRVRDWAAAYAISGDRRFAALAEARSLDLVRDLEFWNNPGSKGLTRAGGAFSVALAYDLCYDAWSESTRREISPALYRAALGMMASMGAGANNGQGNNWQAVRYGAAGMALLACDEPGDRLEKARECYQLLLRHLRANLGSNGWNPEGIGYTIYPGTFSAPFGIAALRHDLGDLRRDVPAYTRTWWTCLAGTVAMPHSYGLGIRADLTDDHATYRPDGTLGLSFHYAPPEHLPAIRWMYDHLEGEQGLRTWDGAHWGGGLYSLLFYPSDIPAANPATAPGLQFVDPSQGVVIFRNRFQDENDIVALVNATARRAPGGHGGPDVNTLRLLGLGSVFITGSGRTADTAGQSTFFAGPPPSAPDDKLGRLDQVRLGNDYGDGEAWVSGSCVGVEKHHRHFLADYSGRAGVPGLFVNAESSHNGKVWRLNTPEFNRIELGTRGFVLHAPNGASLAVTVVEPAAPVFRTGSFRRGNAFRYHEQEYLNNRWVEFDADSRVCVLMTLQNGPSPPVEVVRGLHGSRMTVGGVAFVYQREAGTLLSGEEARASDLETRTEPLRPRGLRVEAEGEAVLRLHWLAEELGAPEVQVQRQESGTESWDNAGRAPVSAGTFVDQGLDPATTYLYRLLATRDDERSHPSLVVTGETWEAGMVRWVEDFSPDGQDHGPWRMIGNDRGFGPTPAEGSSSFARRPKGYLSTGSVRIDKANGVYTENLRMDLSSPRASVAFDWRAQAVTRVGFLLKRADGSWLVSGLAYLGPSRSEWRTQSMVPSEVRTWNLFDPQTLRVGERVQPSPADLADVRGVGLWAAWPINQKWLHIDQFRLLGVPRQK